MNRLLTAPHRPKHPGGMTKPMRSTLILRGWRMGSLQKKITKAEAQGYVMAGPVQYAPVGRKYLATMVMR